MEKKIYIYCGDISKYEYYNDYDAIRGFIFNTKELNYYEEFMYKHDDLKEDDKIYVFKNYNSELDLLIQLEDNSLYEIKYKKDFKR